MLPCAWEARFSTAQLSRWLDASSRRFACRKFLGPADTQRNSALHYVAAQAELPGVRLHFFTGACDEVLLRLPLFERFTGVSQFIAVIRDRDVPHSLLHAGIGGEAMSLEIAALELGSCWVAGNFRRGKVNVARKQSEDICALLPYGQPEDPEGALKRKRKPLKELCLDDPAEWPNWAFQAAESVRQAPSAVNLQPWRFSYHGKTLRLSGRGFPGLDFGIAVLHAQCALAQARHNWRYSADQKSLLISIGEEHEPV